MEAHRKHGKTIKPRGGKFHRNEVAILGAPCAIIELLSASLAKELEPVLTCAYVDASHDTLPNKSPFTAQLEKQAATTSIDLLGKDNDLRIRKLLNEADIALVNGNHFQAEHQVVLVNSKKKESLSRKLDGLTNVLMIILDEGMEEPFDFLNPFLSNTPIYRIAEVNLISQEIQKKFGQNSTELKGLVLTGGKSSRMGKDKGSIDYHGKAQREHAADILQAIVGNSYLSVRDESATFESQYELIADSFLDLGPFGGILSAFRRFPDCAWLVVATDIPGLSSELVTELVKRRNPSKVATCFYNPETKFPEPLITIWEPRAYHVMLEFLANGMSCPRKVLINSNVEMIDEPRYYEDLINVNTPEELKAFTIK